MNTALKRVLISLAVLLLLGICGYGGYYVYSIIKFGHGIGDDDSDLKRYEQELRKQNPDAYIPEEPPGWEGTERVNILLLGGDARGLTKNEAPRSDTIMLASIDPTTKQAYLFSIMRDTYTKIPGHYSNRINTALALGGPNLAMETVGNLLDLDIQYYVFVDFEGFIQLIDALGGIEYEVERNMYYYDPTDPKYKIDLKKGLQVLDGEKALQYVRFRRDRLGDYTRTERQRNLMSALAKKLTSTTSLLTLPNTLKKIEPYITTNIPFDKMLPLASLAYESSKKEIVTAQLPPMELLREENINGMEVITVNEQALRDYVQQLFEQTEQAEQADQTDQTDQSEPTEQTGRKDQNE